MTLTTHSGVPSGTDDTIAHTTATIRAVLHDLEQPCRIVQGTRGLGATSAATDAQVLAAVPPLPPQMLGDSEFRRFHGVRSAYAAGSMANGISSVSMVVAMSRAGYLASYGAAGVLPRRVDAALAELSGTLGDSPYACNLIHSPSEPALEYAIVDACLRHGVRCVEASAFMSLTPAILRYRLAGLHLGPDGVTPRHRLIAKVSRSEVAELFLRPAPPAMIDALVADGHITAEQGQWARRIPVADDITAEADSGGHTDRRPLPVLLPDLIATRDRVASEFPAASSVRVGAAGGLGTPTALAGAFAMGAAYVVTGSINQACVEADQSATAKRFLGTADVADVAMAASSDMFEMGVQVQVLRRGTMFAARANRLFEFYRDHDGIESMPPETRREIEETILRRPCAEVWAECVDYFTQRDPRQLAGAADDPKRRMALIFRWYLGLSSGWAIRGDAERVADYQIWCGPALGAFNRWVADTRLRDVGERRVAEVAAELMRGTAIVTRVAALRTAGVRLPGSVTAVRPQV
ncbi:PfaD family polyunsaturated fatty acid/polyketide biosynthesis protein [Gordonia sp. L191]|uniref:PfaD family polyunsaturated fatty acid/polyketide biosynthesis protein n=1 Tax=Gordonia sp. L191 TaxID=2982699 RepID=UPI0024C08490|nr:PfaD family polyunsaturated fatty acid/polyketide biosynthesis protein [Gordonia sp. L191]WHU48151.1 PfaD family polyunsaturated fatty acid/polyketide biosynthesis protein [Gordonia sp. L191]